MTVSLPATAIDWLLEDDAANPGVRYFALRDLFDLPPEDDRVIAAQAEVMSSGPVPVILAAQHAQGYWQKPGSGYSTKYRGTVWQLIQLDRLGADPAHRQVRSACEYVLTHTLSSSGGFGASGVTREGQPAPSLAIHCLHGNLLAALLHFGWLDDARVQRAIVWQAKAITGEDPALRYYKSGTTGPGFACGSNHGLPCAWGANKAIRALLAIPEPARDAEVRHALQIGAEFLLGRDAAVADYPYYNHVSSTWQHLTLPLSYWSDILETLENLTGLGYGADPRLDHAFELVLGKREASGRWPMEHSINGKTWARVEAKDRPSKWVTLRALTVLRRAGRMQSA